MFDCPVLDKPVRVTITEAVLLTGKRTPVGAKCDEMLRCKVYETTERGWTLKDPDACPLNAMLKNRR
jgi:hypothetical protein